MAETSQPQGQTKQTTVRVKHGLLRYNSRDTPKINNQKTQNIQSINKCTKASFAQQEHISDHLFDTSQFDTSPSVS